MNESIQLPWRAWPSPASLPKLPKRTIRTKSPAFPHLGPAARVPLSTGAKSTPLSDPPGPLPESQFTQGQSVARHPPPSRAARKVQKSEKLSLTLTQISPTLARISPILARLSPTLALSQPILPSSTRKTSGPWLPHSSGCAPPRLGGLFPPLFLEDVLEDAPGLLDDVGAQLLEEGAEVDLRFGGVERALGGDWYKRGAVDGAELAG